MNNAILPLKSQKFLIGSWPKISKHTDWKPKVFKKNMNIPNLLTDNVFGFQDTRLISG
jgi:hypothetical protein